jgi:hypothetical protein
MFWCDSFVQDSAWAANCQLEISQVCNFQNLMRYLQKRSAKRASSKSVCRSL